MNRTVSAVATLAAAVLGVSALAANGSIAADLSTDAKREDALNVVLTADDDDDDGDDDTDTGNGDAGSGVSRDNTNSRHTGVSRDLDRSRGDLTRDWTRDGGDRTRDHSRHSTNDRSRNDTR